MDEDARWLRDFVETGSDRAFSALVSRHFNLVYATALRVCHGDAHLAQDVAQSVFTDLARKAKSWPRDLFLGGWLYQHTCFAASNAVRKELRRRNRERRAFEMNLANDESDPNWLKVGPALDKAMSRLGAANRNALALRFFEQRSFKSVGGALGLSEEAARKRVERALEKLRGFFTRSGLSVSAAVLTSALDTYAGAGAPSGVAALVASAALAESAKNTGIGLSLIKLMTMTKANMAAAAVVATLATALVIQSRSKTRPAQENLALRQRFAQLEKQQSASNQASPSPMQDLNQDQFRELMRLRGEAGLLREQLARAKAAASIIPATAAPTPPTTDPAEEQRQIAIAKMQDAKAWMLAFLLYAHDHEQACPTNFDQAMSYRTNNPLEANLMTNQLQFFYQGSLNEITNPAQTIVLGEIEPTEGPEGGWNKVYGFADGHAELHHEADGDFTSWEGRHMQVPPTP